MSAQQIAHVARRIPMIKFTHGKRLTTVQQVPQLTVQQTTATPPAKPAQTVSSKPGVLITRIDQFYQLPKRYSRKPLTSDEMDAINVRDFEPKLFPNYRVVDRFSIKNY